MNSSTSQLLCTWRDEAECGPCDLQYELGCRFDRREFVFFVLNQIPSLVMALFGLVVIGLLVDAWWPLVVFVGACIILWGLGLETRVLCSHCPYWAEDSRTLHCWALTGSPKIWRYRPGPMNGVEKAIILGFFGFLVAFPVSVEGYGIWLMAREYGVYGLYALLGMIGVTVATLLAALQFVLILRRHYCEQCVNFSCPLNRVPKVMVDAYLRKNPVMREAWEKAGYHVGGA
ncbi:MAG: hypothetical protein PVI59_02430 [Anaerolineae bacterium]